jgi:hemolysin activation/secretion protein
MDGGLNTWSMMVSEGQNGKDPSSQAEQEAGVAGRFAKLRYSLTRTQTLTDSLSGYVSLSGQLASRNMDSSEELYLGGPLNVRSYGGSQGGATQGNLTTFELRQNLPEQTQLTGFYDVGNVQMYKFNTPGVAYNSYFLQGVGASFSWNGPEGLVLKAIVAHRLGELNSAVFTYLSQNGGISSNRLWLNASIPFSF